MDFPKFKDAKELESLLELMRRYELAELEIEIEGRKIRFRKSEPRVAPEAIAYAPPAVTAPGAPPAADAGALPPEPVAEGHEVTSPLVGTFYRSPSPEADLFVQDGDRVEAETVLCIIEAMKVMNEIRAGVTGVLKEILVKNAEPVEFGQPLFRIETE